jgi:hypothetical protein
LGYAALKNQDLERYTLEMSAMAKDLLDGVVVVDDCYKVFTKMVDSGEFPEKLDELIAID